MCTEFNINNVSCVPGAQDRLKCNEFVIGIVRNRGSLERLAADL